MRHSSDEYEMLDSIALQVRIDYGFTGCYLDVFKLASVLGIVLTPYSKLSEIQFKTVHSILELEDGFTIARYENGKKKYYTFYNDEVSLCRQRFTIAHEIKHVLFNETTPSEKEEDLANHFARYILAPTCLVMRYADESPFDIASVFDISVDALENALNAALHRIAYFGQKLSKIEGDFLSLFKN